MNFNGKLKNTYNNQIGGGVSACKLNKWVAFILSLLGTAVLCCAFILSFFISNDNKVADALNSAGINAAYKIGNSGDGSTLTDVYDSSSDTFNKKLMIELLSKTTGIKGAVIDEVENYINTNGVSKFGSKVIQAPTIGTNAGNTTQGVVVRVNGLDWMVTSLTIAPDASGNDAVIATLYLADTTEKSIFNAKGNAITNVKPSVMYGTSTIRTNLNSASGTFAMFSSGTFAQKYLIQPKNIPYQHTETMHGMDTRGTSASNTWGNCANDALDNLGNTNYRDSKFNIAGKTGYADWGNDYIWLPSSAEAGMNRTGSSAWSLNSIWGLNNAQRTISITNDAGVWYRTIHQNMDYNVVSVYGKDGQYISYECNTSQYLRPAIHLNLTAATGYAFEDLTDLTNTYNGNDQSANLSTIAPWYKSAYHGDSSRIEFTYPTGGIINVGEYWVKATINLTYVSSLTTQGHSICFAGTPDTSDSAHMESDTVRWFKFTIKKAKIALDGGTFSTDNQGVVTAPGTLQVDQSALKTNDITNSLQPTLAVRYTGTGGYSSTTRPTAAGTYTATVIITNPTVCNYELDKTYSYTYTKGKERAAAPTIATADSTVTYDGTTKTFNIQNYDTTLMTAVLPTGITYNTSTQLFEATAVGDYTINFGLNDSTIYDWNDSTGGTGLRTITVSVKPIALTISFSKTPDPANWAWASGDSVDVYIDVSGVLTGETLDMQLSYLETTTQAKVAAGVVTGNCTGQALNSAAALTQGGYEIVAELNAANADNKNYTLTGSTVLPKAFTVGAAQISCNSVDWQFLRTGASGALDATGGAGYTYNGSEFEFDYNADNITISIDVAALPSGVVLNTGAYVNGYQNATQKNANATGHYTTKVSLKAPSGSVFDNGTDVKEFSVDWIINKADFDLTNVKWAYENPANSFVYTGTPIKNELENLPAGLTARYTDNTETNSEIPHTAKVTGFTTADSNYNLPDVTEARWSCAWQIERRKIPVMWTDKQTTDSNSSVFFLPVLSDASVAQYVQYEYYTTDPRTDSSATPIGLSGITVTPSSETTYYVKVMLDQSNQTVLDNFLIDDPVGNGVTDFTVGSNKTIVRIDILQSGLVYDGTTHFELKITSGSLPMSSFIVQIAKAKADGSTPDPADFDTIDLATKANMPIDAGKYVVMVDLSNSDQQYNYLPDKLFNYEILQAEFDVSQLVWVDERTGTPYATPFEYEAKLIRDENGELVLDAGGKMQLKKTEHELVLYNGTDKLTKQTDGGGDYYLIKYALKDGTEKELKLYVTSGADQEVNSEVNTYRIALSFDYDATNFAAPAFDDYLDWEITKAVLDLTSVRWSYTEPFVYTIDENGEEVEFGVRLEGLPDYLEYAVTYTGDLKSTQANRSNKPNYAASFTFAEDTQNYEALTLPPGLDQTLLWEIKPRTFAVPSATAKELVFRDEGHDFVEHLKLGEDWARYLSIEVMKGQKLEVVDVSPEEVKDADSYTLRLTPLAAAGENIQWADKTRAPQRALFVIAKLQLKVTGWEEKGTMTTHAVFEPMDGITPEVYVAYRYTIDGLYADGGTITTDPTDYSTDYYVQLIVGEDYEGNVELIFADGEPDWDMYNRGDDPFVNVEAIERPYIETDSIVYNGEEIEFVLKNFNEEYLQLSSDSDSLSQKNVGKYTITIRFKTGAAAKWSDTNNRDSVVLNFYVELLVLDIPTCDDEALRYTGEEQEYLPEGFESKFMTIRGNTATDAGKYELTVGLIDPVNTAWKITAESVSYKTALAWKATLEGEDEKTSDKKLEWKINRAVISSNWNTEGEKPALTLSTEEQSMVEYTYYDENGNAVPADKLKKGKQYTVQASLKDKYKNNYEFEDAEVSYLSPFDEPFTFGGAGGGFSFETLFTDWWWVILIAVLALLFIILLIVLLKRRKKKEESVTAVAQATPAEAPAPAPAQTAVTPAPAQQTIPAPERVYIQAEHAPMSPVSQVQPTAVPMAPAMPMMAPMAPMAPQYGFNGGMGVDPMLQMQRQQMQMQQQQQAELREKLMRELKEQRLTNQQLMMQLRAQQMQAQQQPAQPAPAPTPAPAAPSAPQVIVIDVDK